MLKANINKVVLTNNNADREVLGNINFSISNNMIYSVLGKNGSGKSTLIKSLTGLLNSDLYKVDGKVLWFDENIFEMKKVRLLSLRKTEITYVMQDLTWNFDPLKTIQYYFDHTGFKEKTISLQLKSFLLPDYQIISNLHSYELSGGMAQRISLLIALLSNPKLLILDEPTSAIDYANINLIKLKLLEFKKTGGSVLIVTQDIDFAKEISDKIAFLNDNKLSEFIEIVDFFKDSELSLHNTFLQSYKELQ
ncbi:MAG: ABC transporter ATP-binding protein [Ignavibacteriales bacterium]|nr:MAG: ABC transporter ATP-binding protein [Ignavibacteriales bacterium]